jgi:hypothetical protein
LLTRTMMLLGAAHAAERFAEWTRFQLDWPSPQTAATVEKLRAELFEALAQMPDQRTASMELALLEVSFDIPADVDGVAGAELGAG